MITNRSTFERIQMLSQPRKSLSGKNRSYYIPELIVYSWLNLTNCKRWSLFFAKEDLVSMAIASLWVTFFALPLQFKN